QRVCPDRQRADLPDGGSGAGDRGEGHGSLRYLARTNLWVPDPTGRPRRDLDGRSGSGQRRTPAANSAANASTRASPVDSSGAASSWLTSALPTITPSA